MALNRHGHLRGTRIGIFPPIHQADATLTQANPVSGTLYTILAATRNARIISIEAEVTYTVQPNLQVHITIDGVTITFTIAAPVSGTAYFAQLVSDLAMANQLLGGTDRLESRAFVIEGRSIQVQLETTGGTVQVLAGRVKYAKW